MGFCTPKRHDSNWNCHSIEVNTIVHSTKQYVEWLMRKVRKLAYVFAILQYMLHPVYISYDHWTYSKGWYIYVTTKAKSSHYSLPNWDMLLEFDKSYQWKQTDLY